MFSSLPQRIRSYITLFLLTLLVALPKDAAHQAMRINDNCGLAPVTLDIAHPHVDYGSLAHLLRSVPSSLSRVFRINSITFAVEGFQITSRLYTFHFHSLFVFARSSARRQKKIPVMTCGVCNLLQFVKVAPSVGSASCGCKSICRVT